MTRVVETQAAESKGVESILKQDRIVVTAGLVLVIVLAWSYILTGAGMEMSATDMPAPLSWTPGYALLMFFMWWVMMIAMMLPGASPTILLAAAINRKAGAGRRPYGSATVFALGYLLAWAGYSLLAALAQWGLATAGVLSGLMQISSHYLAGGLLVAAGLWQFTPIKQACLSHCRSPVHFLTRHRRQGTAGALYMGLHHGSYCLGCCWFLMLLLFVGGVMNLYWIAALALWVLAEKLLRAGRSLSRVCGAMLIIWGLLLLSGLL